MTETLTTPLPVELVPHTDAWRRAQTASRKRDRKLGRIERGITAQVEEAAQERVPNVELKPNTPRVGQRAHLKAARKEYQGKLPSFLNRRARRSLARRVRLTGVAA